MESPPRRRPVLAPDLFAGFLKEVPVWPRRLLLDTGGTPLQVPMLRGVWGSALHDLEASTYAAVFAPPGQEAVPGYLLRQAPAGVSGRVAVDWLLFGPACAHDRALCRAWDIASGRGLGPRRRPFLVRAFLDLDPTGVPVGSPGPWPLSRCRWPCDPLVPCRLAFPSPLRLLRRGRLIEKPTLADLVVSAQRRLRAFLPEHLWPEWDALREPLLEASRRQPGVWQGQRQDLHRYSARQAADLELRGVCGVLDLPEGPGALWPLLAAACWVHLGKATAFGLGRPEVQPWPG